MKKRQLSLLLGALAWLGQGLQAQTTAIFADAQAAYKRGEAHYRQALYGSAQDAFAEVLAHFPTRDAQTQEFPAFVEEAELYYGLSALRRGDAQGETRLLHFIKRHEPSNLAMRARLEMGRYYYQERQYDKAIANFSAIKSLDMSLEELTEMKFQLGYSYFVQKQFSQAAALFQQIRGNNKSPYYFPANYYLGVAQFSQNDYNAALESFKTASGSKQYKDVVPAYICQIYFAQKKYTDLISYAEPLVNQSGVQDKAIIAQLLGQSYFELGQYVKARPQLEAALAAQPKVNQELLYQVAYTQYKTGDYAKAVQNFEQLNVLESALGQNALYNMADCHLKLGNKPVARQAFRRASEMNFDQTVKDDALMNYGKLSFELGFDTEAIQTLQKIPANSANYNEAQNLLGDIFLNTRDYDNALRTLRAIKDKTPKLKESHQKVAYFRGIQHYQDKNLAEALKHFDESLEIGVHQETKALAHFWKAELLYQQDKFAASIAEYGRYLIIAPTLKQIPANSSIGVAYYGMGYAHLRQEQYSQAGEQFSKAVSTIEKQRSSLNDRYVTDFVYPDAVLRAADCYLYLGGTANHDKALKFYQTIINSQFPNRDYALYQASLIHGLRNDRDNVNQLTLLNKLVQDFPQSPYADDAAYSRGVVYMNQRKFDLAIQAFEDLQKSYPNSELRNKGLMRLGVIAFGQNRNEEALNYYKAVFRNNPQGDEAKDALAGIQEIYIDMGNPDGYFNFINTVPDYQPSEDDREAITFQSAERLYRNRDWEKAAQVFGQYLQRSPNGSHSLRAYFLRGECYFDLKQFDKAFADYQVVLNRPPSAHTETAAYRAGVIAYHHQRDFAQAYTLFNRLEPLASTEQMRFDARQYLLRSAFFAPRFNEVPAIAEKFLQEPRANNAERAEAYYYMAKAQQQNRQFEAARQNYNKTIELSGDDIRAAEARHQLAAMLYAERKLDDALQACMNSNRLMSNYDYWLVKNYILMADIYAEKGNLVQAKMTLESIVNNYQGDKDLLDEAKRKLEGVRKAERDASRLNNPR